MRTTYEARTKDELPVLVRWFEGVEPPVADYLIGAGISPDQISFEGRGKREPADLNDPAKNRRAVISFAAAKGVKSQ